MPLKLTPDYQENLVLNSSGPKLLSASSEYHNSRTVIGLQSIVSMSGRGSHVEVIHCHEGHLAMSGDILVSTVNFVEVEVLLATSRQKPGMLLNTPQYTGQSPQQNVTSGTAEQPRSMVLFVPTLT